MSNRLLAFSLSSTVLLLGTFVGQPSNVLAQKVTSELCTYTSETEIAKLFDRWNSSLQTNDPDKVTANYADDAVLLPTVSNKPRTNRAEIRDYFEHFLKKRPVGKIDSRLIKIDCNYALDTGLYTFTIDDHGKPAKVPARYTFVYKNVNGNWLILNHHSSAMPEPTK